jgi:two-component system, chemotaxis family, response regulator WspF
MRIAIVNDLTLAQAVLRRVVESVPGYTVAWTAADGAEAVRKAAADRPDVVLMDMVMPVMDGVEATRRIMAASPCPVLIVTASLGANFGKVYEALGAGGLDAVRTPTLGPGGKVRDGEAILERLAKLAQASRMRSAECGMPNEKGSASHSAPRNPHSAMGLPPLLAVGASTGGPEAVAQALAGLAPAPPGPVVVVQHIAADFAAGFASWLQVRTGLPTGVALAGDAPGAGRVYVAGSDDHLTLRPDRRFAYTAEPKDYPYRPSVGVFFASLAAHWPGPGIAVLLTGMGNDGARELAELKARGWHTVAQDRSTSVIYGMPKAAVELNAASEVLPLPQIGPAVRARLAALAGAARGGVTP